MTKKSFFAIVLGGLLCASCKFDAADNPVPTPAPEEDPAEEPSTAWTWDTSAPNGTVWGNMGYCGGDGAEVGSTGSAQWWGVTSEEEFMAQLHHTNDGKAHGDESMDAYFLLFDNGKIERHAGDGTLIKDGVYEFKEVADNKWKVADLLTTAGTILWPYEINSNGNMPTQFEVIYRTDTKMTLVYPDGGEYDNLGNWSEATYWHFKVKGSTEPAAEPTPAPAPTSKSIADKFTNTWNKEESFTLNADGTITYNAQKWGGLAAWLVSDEVAADFSDYSKVVFEFTEATKVNTQIFIQGSEEYKEWGEVGITKLECSFSGKDVSAVKQVALQCSDVATITIKNIYLVK